MQWEGQAQEGCWGLLATSLATGSGPDPVSRERGGESCSRTPGIQLSHRCVCSDMFIHVDGALTPHVIGRERPLG